MFRLAVRRLLYSIPILIGVSIICFLLMNVLPGSAAGGLINDQMTDAEKYAAEDRLGLHDPLPIRYWDWLVNIFQGDLGFSQQRHRDVSELLGQAWANTFILAIVSAVIGVVLGILLGFIAGTRRGSWVDKVVSTFSLAGLSIPSFFLGVLLLSVFASKLQLLPAGGWNGMDYGLGGAIESLILPVATGSLVTAGITARVMRAAIVDTMSADFIETLRAKGLSEFEVRKHVMRNAISPVLTTSGVQFGYLLGGSVVVETIFRWPGMGTLTYNAISSRDLPVIQGTILIIAFAFVLINLVVDIVQAAIDPRVRGTLT
ncbi:MAG: ABC transporter permease [Cumulibacter sp.]